MNCHGYSEFNTNPVLAKCFASLRWCWTLSGFSNFFLTIFQSCSLHFAGTCQLSHHAALVRDFSRWKFPLASLPQHFCFSANLNWMQYKTFFSEFAGFERFNNNVLWMVKCTSTKRIEQYDLFIQCTFRIFQVMKNSCLSRNETDSAETKEGIIWHVFCCSQFSLTKMKLNFWIYVTHTARTIFFSSWGKQSLIQTNTNGFDT